MDKKKRKKYLTLIMPLIGIAIGVIIAPLDLLPLWLSPQPNTIEKALEEGINADIDGILLYVETSDKPPSIYSAGVNNKMAGSSLQADTLFKIASISKMFMAVSIVKLVDNQSLSIDDTLATLLPQRSQIINNADSITLGMLVQHTSGIPDFVNQQGHHWFEPASQASDYFALVANKPPLFSPGEDYRYSNTNYLLLGEIMDRALGYHHSRFIQQHILAPLSLSDTYYSLSEVDNDAVASGYWYGYQDDLKSLNFVAPGGSMIASAGDVATFIRALNKGALLSPSEQQLYERLYPLEHDGWFPGYHSKARYYADIDTVVVQFTNTTGGETWGLANVVGGKATAMANIVFERALNVVERESQQ